METAVATGSAILKVENVFAILDSMELIANVTFKSFKSVCLSYFVKGQYLLKIIYRCLLNIYLLFNVVELGV